VPDVVNLTQATAEQRLSSAGFAPQVTFSPSGSVPSGVGHHPGPPGGTPLRSGSTVSIVVSTGPSTTTTGDGTTTSTTTTTAP
jgi:eukaryotic-like serine/threonine-protein kinase